MNNTTEQIQQERIDVLNETIDIMNRIIKSDEEQINILNASKSVYFVDLQDKNRIKGEKKGLIKYRQFPLHTSLSIYTHKQEI